MVVPFVGTDGIGLGSTLGVGILPHDDTRVTVVGGAPHQLIRAWRSYQMLVHAPSIPDLGKTLTACWEVADPCRALDGDEYFNYLADIFGGTMVLQLCRARAPSITELEDMIERLRGGHIHVNAEEIRSNIGPDRLADTTRLQRLITRLSHEGHGYSQALSPQVTATSTGGEFS